MKLDRTNKPFLSWLSPMLSRLSLRAGLEAEEKRLRLFLEVSSKPARSLKEIEQSPECEIQEKKPLRK